MKLSELTKMIRRTTGSRRKLPVRHIRYACRIIQDHEQPLAAAPCSYQDKKGLLVVTDARLFFVMQSFIGTVCVDEFSLKSIKAVSYQFGLFGGFVEIKTGSEAITVNDLHKTGIERLTEAIRYTINKPDNEPPTLSLAPDDRDPMLSIADFSETRQILDDGHLLEGPAQPPRKFA